MRYNYIMGVALTYLLSSACHAGVFERDLVPGSGDGLLTFDDVNNREWLDVTESLLANFPNGFEEVLGELEPGGQFEGFRWANREDVFALAESAGIDTTTLDSSINQQSSLELVNLLSPTRSFPPGDSFGLRGYLNDLEPFCSCYLIGSMGSSPSDSGIVSFASVLDSNDRPPQITGFFFYRTVVPEPSTLAFAIIPLLLLLTIRFERNAQPEPL